MRNKNIFLVQILTSFAIWIFLVFILYNIGLLQNCTPVQLGIISFCFSGAMALVNGLGSAFIKYRSAKSCILIGLLISILIIISFYNIATPIIQYVLIFLISSCYSLISIGKDKIVENGEQKFDKINERIFRIIRFLGPIVGGILVYFFTYKEVLLIISVLYILSLLFMISIKLEGEVFKERLENKFIKTNKYEKNPRLIKSFFVLSFIVTLFIQVIDAQLVTLFKYSNLMLPTYIGVCIGCSGIGVFIIAEFFESKLVKEKLLYISCFCLGVLLFLAGSYMEYFGEIKIFLIILIFSIGGLCWQVVMGTFENIIKSYKNKDLMMRIFTIVGILTLISYSTGALISGFLVNILRIYLVYIIAGVVLLVSAVVITCFNMKYKED
ncbi:MFS transporter [Clostridium sp. YIM B02569]|uniref:MFS transporter n=1 Tax=Clostridium sp. YIM B02569 TaxID=2911967 RepID=UPI001EEBB95F|nr:MFS transporter [Clostridium sp. YIM B02569]